MCATLWRSSPQSPTERKARGAGGRCAKSARHRAAGRDRSRRATRDRPAVTRNVERALARVEEFQRVVPVESGPVATITGLSHALAVVDGGARDRWLHTARLQAIWQPCSRSLLGLRSGLRCWQAFCTRVLRRPHIALPPAAAELAAWSTIFRCKGTFDNYVAYVRVGCLLVGAARTSVPSTIPSFAEPGRQFGQGATSWLARNSSSGCPS